MKLKEMVQKDIIVLMTLSNSMKDWNRIGWAEKKEEF